MSFINTGLSILWSYTPWGNKEWIQPYEKLNYDELSYYDLALKIKELSDNVNHIQWGCSVDGVRVDNVVQQLIRRLPNALANELLPESVSIIDSVAGSFQRVVIINLRDSRTEDKINRLLNKFALHRLTLLSKQIANTLFSHQRKTIFLNRVLTLKDTPFDDKDVIDRKIKELFISITPPDMQATFYWTLARSDGEIVFTNNPRSTLSKNAYQISCVAQAGTLPPRLNSSLSTASFY